MAFVHSRQTAIKPLHETDKLAALNLLMLGINPRSFESAEIYTLQSYF